MFMLTVKTMFTCYLFGILA